MVSKKSTMKKLISFAFVIVLITSASCNFSAGVKKDFGSGLSYEYNGFAVDEVVFVNSNNERAGNNEVSLNTQVAIVTQGLVNYELKDGKAFPGLYLSVQDKSGNAVIDEADLFSQAEGFSAEDASAIRGSITIGEPMQSGQTYDVVMRIWDKNKPENELTITMELVVK
jgi:predicted small secreted protein